MAGSKPRLQSTVAQELPRSARIDPVGEGRDCDEIAKVFLNAKWTIFLAKLKYDIHFCKMSIVLKSRKCHQTRLIRTLDNGTITYPKDPSLKYRA